MIDSVCGVSVWDDKEGYHTLRLENSSVTPELELSPTNIDICTGMKINLREGFKEKINLTLRFFS